VLLKRKNPRSAGREYNGLMNTWLLGLFLKPFVAVLLFGVTMVIARLLFPYIPAGPLKRLLYDPTLRERYPWRFAIGFMLACAAAWGVGALFML
jgi:hypothetical protein